MKLSQPSELPIPEQDEDGEPVDVEQVKAERDIQRTAHGLLAEKLGKVILVLSGELLEFTDD